MKRLLSLNLILVMLLGMLPATAMAAESTQVGEGSYAEYIAVDGTQYDAASDDRISGDGWTYQSGILTLTGYRGGAIETNVKLSVFFDGENTVTAKSGHGISSTAKLTLRPAANSAEDSSLAVYAAEGYHAVFTEGTAEIWPSALTLVGGGTSAVSAARITYGSYWPHTLKVGDDAESAVEGEYTTQNYYAIEPIPCFMTLYGNGGTTEDGEESYRFQVDFTTGTGADLFLYDRQDVFAQDGKEQVGWGINPEGTGITYSHNNGYSYANGNYDASLYALWNDTHVEIRRIWENTYGSVTWTSNRSNVVKIGESYTLPNVNREGYTLDGWRGDDGVLYAANTSVAVTKSATYTAEYTPVNATASKLMFRQATWDRVNGVYYEDETKALSTGWDASIESGNLVQFYFGTEDECVKVGMDELTTTDGVYLYEQDGFVWIRGSGFGAQQIIYTDAEGAQYTMPVNIGLPPVSFYSQPKASEKTYIGEYSPVYVSGENNVVYVAAAAGYSVFDVVLNENFDAFADVEVAEDGTHAKITVTESFADGRYGMSITYGTDKWSTTMTRRLTLNNNNPKLMIRHMAWDSKNQCYYENAIYDLQNSWYSYITSGAVVKFYFGTKDEYTEVSLDQLHSDGIRLDVCEEQFIFMEPTGFGAHEVIYTAPDGVRYALPVTVVLPSLGFYSTPEATEKSYLYQEFTMSGENNTFYLVPSDGILTKVNMSDEFAKIAKADIAEDGSYAAITVNGSPSGRWYELTAELESDDWSWTEYANLRISDGNPHLAFRGMSWGENGWYENPNEAMYGNLDLHITSGRPVKFYFVTGEDCVAVSLDELTVSGSGVALRSEEDHIRIIAEQFGTWYIGYTAADGEEYRLPVTVGVPTYAFYSTPIASVDNYITEFGVTDESKTFYMISAKHAITAVELEPELAKIATVEVAKDGSYAAITVTGTPEGRVYSAQAHAEDANGNSFSGQWGLRIYDNTTHLMFRGMEWDEENQCHYEDFGRELESGWNTSIHSGNVVKFYFGTEKENFEVDLDELTCDGGIELRVYEDQFIMIDTQNKFGVFNIYYTDADKVVHTLPVSVGAPPIGFYSEPVAAAEYYLYEKFTFTEENNTFYLVPQWGSLCNLNVDKRLAAIADVEVAEDGSYAKFTVHGLPGEEWCEVRTDLMWENGDINPDWGASLRIVDGKPHLMFRSMAWDDENQCHYEDPEHPMQSSWEASIGSGAPVRFYFGTEDNYVYVPVEKLTVSSGLYLSPDVDFVHLGAEAFGWQEITYAADDGILHILPVTVGLPELGFYKDKTASVENFLYDSFVVTGENNTFYLVSTTNTITDVMLNPSLAKIATVEVSEDGSYAAITVTGSPSGYWYSMLVEMKNGNWTGSWNRGLNLIDGNPHLMFREADWTPETGWFDNPNMGMQTSWSREINSSAPGRFFFGTDEKYVPVSLKQLSVSGDGIEVGGSDDMLWLNCLNEGVYYVTYTADDGAEYTFRVNVYLPALGFYTMPVASGEYFTRVYTVSEDNNNVLYLMPSEGTLTKLALGERLAEIAEVEWAKDGSCVAIIITGIPDGGWYDVTATYETAKGSWAETVEVLLKNGFESEEPEVPEEPEVTVEVVDEGQCGDYLYWVLAVETDAKGNSKVVLTFDGSGEMYDYMTSDPDWFPFNDEIEEIRLSEKQTSIGAFAFGFMDGIYSIVIPASVKSIGSCAFAQCVNLHEVVFEGGAPAIAENAFNNVTAACLYPENDATWTTVVRANYGGKLDWVAYDAGTGDGEDSGKPHLMYYMVGSNGEDGWADMGYGMEDAWYFDGTYLCCQVVFCFGTEDNWVPVDFNQLWVTDSKAVELTDRGYTDEGYSVVDVSVFAFGDYSICYKDTDGTVYSMPVYVYLPSVGFFSTPVMSEDSYLHQFVLTETNRTFYLVSDEGDIVDVVMDEDYVDCTEVTIKGNYAAITFTKDPAYTWCRPYLNVTIDRGEDGYGEWGLGLDVLVGEPEEPEVPEVPEISASGTCGMYGDNLIWTLENGVLTISGYGEMQDCSGYTAPWNAYYSHIKEVVVEEGVTTIGPWAFAYCEQMTKVTLPETLNVIDYGAFVLCSALEKVTIPAYVTLINSQAFCNCTALSEVYFLGDAPKFNEDMYPGLDSFANVVADCYYPADNTTWTADVMLNYGGYDGLLTWVPYTGDIEEPDVPEEPENGQLMFYHVGENAEGKWADMGWGMQDGWYSDGFGSSCVVFCFGTEDKWTPVNLSNLWVSDSEAVVLAIRGETVEGYSAISMDVFAFGDFSVYYEAADGTVYSMPVHVYPPDVGFYSQPVISGEYYLNQFNLTETNRTFYLVSDRGDITDVELNDGFADCTEVTIKGNYVTITFTEIPDFTQKQLFVDVYIDKDGTGVGEWSAGRGVQIVVGESGGDVEEPDVPSDDYAVSDLYLDAVNGEVYLCWTAPKTAPKGEVWYTACFSYDGGETWEYGIGSGACDETCVSLSGMPLAWYHDETVTTAFKVITEVDGVEVAECIANLTLSVEDDQQLPAAKVTVTAPAVEGGKYTFTVTGLTPNTAVWLIGQNYNSGSLSGGYSDEEGTCTFTWSSSRMEKYLADATSVYLVRELTGASAAKDGLSATYTISNRGDWASLADAVNGGGSEEPEQPDDLAVTDLHFKYLGVMPYLFWTAPAGVEGDLRYTVHVSTDNGKTWTMLSFTSQDMISLTGLDAAVYNAIKVETELNDVVVAQSSAKLTLTVTKGKDLPAATVVFTAPETEGENYKFTISGLTPYTQFNFVMERVNGSNSTGSRSDADGKYSDTKSYSTMSKYLADSTSVYLVKEFSGGYVSEDGLSASFTVSNRGDWALVSDAVNGGGSEEPEQPDEPDEPEIPDGEFGIEVWLEVPSLMATITGPANAQTGPIYGYYFYNTEDPDVFDGLGAMPIGAWQPFDFREGTYNAWRVLLTEDGSVLGEGLLAKPIIATKDAFEHSTVTLIKGEYSAENGGWAYTMDGLDLANYTYTLETETTGYYIYSDTVYAEENAFDNGAVLYAQRNSETDEAFLQEVSCGLTLTLEGGENEGLKGQCGDNLFWALKSRVDANGENCYELIITGTGAMYDFTYKNLPGWWDYMKQIKWIELPEGMTSVSAHAFENCYYVTELTIPDSVESLGENAFVYMSYLEKLDLGEGLKTIGRAAFYGCDKSLKEVVIPDSVTYIGVSAFASCDVLEKVTLGSGLITIDDYAFEFDESLTEIVIPDSVTEIGSLAFNECYALTKVSVGSGVKSIDYRAFANCIKLTEVTFTGDAPVMEREAFVGVTAKCLYPAAKAGWTTEMLASYGGNLTWEPYGYADATQKVGMIALELVDKYPVLVWTAPEQPREDLFYRVVIMDGNGKEWMRVDTDKTRVEISDIPAGNYSVRVASCFGEAGLEAAALETSLTVLETASKYAAKVMIRAEMDAVYFSGLNPDSLILFETDCSSAVARMYADSKGLAELYGWEYAAYAGTNYRVKELSIERADNGGLLVLYTALGWTAEGEGWYSVDDALPKAAAPESIETEGLEDLTEEEAAAIVDAAAGITVELVADQVTDIETGDGESVEVEIVLDVAVLGYETPVVDDGSAIIGGSRNLVLDIEPKAVVTTTDSDGVSSSVTQTVDTTGVYVTVKIPLPAGFAKVGEQLYVIHTKDSGARTVHAVKVQSDENGVLFVSFMNANGFSTFDVTANIASVNGVQYDDLNEALKAAEAVNGTVTMLFDTTVTGVVIPSGVTLNLADTTLTAGYVVGLNGSYLTANANSGKLVVNKGSLVLPEEGYISGTGKDGSTQYILPIWDPSENCYLFSLFVANTRSDARSLFIDEEKEEIYFQFKHQATGAINKGLLADGASDNALKVIVRLVWNTGDGEAYQDFVYNDRFVGEVTGSKDYTFTLTGYSALNIDLDTLSVTAMIVSDSGATAFGDVWTKENAK